MRRLVKLLGSILIFIIIVLALVTVAPIWFGFTELISVIESLNIVVAILIFTNSRSFEDKLTWLFIVTIIPGLGLLFYLFFGLDYKYTRNARKSLRYSSKEVKDALGETKYPIGFKMLLNSELDFMTLIASISHTPIYFNNTTELLNNGDEKFPRLFEDMRNATKFIHLEYFIIKDSLITDELCEILMEKSKEGLEVRVLFDYFGAIKLSKHKIKQLKEAGVCYEVFNPFKLGVVGSSINYRNHRKIAIIDGSIGYTGGMNFSDEYNHQDKYYGFWRDTHIRVEGDGVRALHVTFIKDWYATTKESLMDEKYLFAQPYKRGVRIAGIQFIEDGPNQRETVLKNVFFKGIMEAQKTIRIATPYLIPSFDILQALKIASHSGVKVQILLPGLPDKKFVYEATKSFVEELVESGVEIYFYKKNFMHSKILVIDDKIASIGTVNFDFRSFDLHFENTAILYLDPTIRRITKEFDEDLKDSTQVDLQKWKGRSFYSKLIQLVARIFSPMF